MKSDKINIILKPKGVALLFVFTGILCVTAFSQNILQSSFLLPKEGASIGERKIYGKAGLAVVDDEPTQWMVAHDTRNYSTLSVSTRPLAMSEKGFILTEFRQRPIKDDSRLQRPLGLTIYPGDNVVLSFWARSGTKSQIRAILAGGVKDETQTPGSRVDTDLFDTVQLTPDWRKYQISFRCLREYLAGKAYLQFHPDRFAGTYELAGVMMTDYGSNAINSTTNTQESKEGKK